MSDKTRSFFVFEAAGNSFGIPLDAIREILPLPLLSRPPGIPSIIEGFLNLGGQALAVINLKRLFRLDDSAPGPYSHLIVIKKTGTALAVFVDRAEGMIDVQPDAVMPVTQNYSFNDCLEADAKSGARTVHILSIEKLLLKEEQSRISELQKMEQERLDQIMEPSQ